MLVDPNESVGLAVPEAFWPVAESAACSAGAFGEPVKTLKKAAISGCGRLLQNPVLRFQISPRYLERCAWWFSTKYQ